MDDAAFRQSVVGAAEVAALFDASPWVTRYELWHRKRGTIATPDFNAVVDGKPENERIYFGVKLEPIVVEAACERWGYVPEPTPERLTNGKGLGGHPDRIVTCPERGRGILEAKTVDWLVEKSWGDEPPLHYLLQAQAYAGLAGTDWCDIVWLTSGNRLSRHQEPFRPTLFAEIERRVAAFWDDVRDGREPPVDYTRDGKTLVEVLGDPTEELADLRDDLTAEQWAMDFAAGKAMRDAGEAQMEAAKTRLIERIGTAGKALLPSYRLTANRTKDTPDREAKPGEIIRGRRGYRRFDLKEIAA